MTPRFCALKVFRAAAAWQWCPAPALHTAATACREAQACSRASGCSKAAHTHTHTHSTHTQHTHTHTHTHKAAHLAGLRRVVVGERGVGEQVAVLRQRQHQVLALADTQHLGLHARARLRTFEGTRRSARHGMPRRACRTQAGAAREGVTVRGARGRTFSWACAARRALASFAAASSSGFRLSSTVSCERGPSTGRLAWAGWAGRRAGRRAGLSRAPVQAESGCPLRFGRSFTWCGTRSMTTALRAAPVASSPAPSPVWPGGTSPTASCTCHAGRCLLQVHEPPRGAQLPGRLPARHDAVRRRNQVAEPAQLKSTRHKGVTARAVHHAAAHGAHGEALQVYDRAVLLGLVHGAACQPAQWQRSGQLGSGRLSRGRQRLHRRQLAAGGPQHKGGA